jgi:hypothetical protein
MSDAVFIQTQEARVRVLGGYKVVVNVVVLDSAGFGLVVETSGGPKKRAIRTWPIPGLNTFTSREEADQMAGYILDRIGWVSVDGKPNIAITAAIGPVICGEVGSNHNREP